MAQMDFTEELKRLLDEYGDEVRDILEEEVKKVAKDAAKELKQTSPRGDGEKHYADGWTSKVEGDTAIVYNRTKPGLAHLLEHGYQGRRDHVDGRPHIAPVEEKYSEELVERVERRLEE